MVWNGSFFMQNEIRSLTKFLVENIPDLEALFIIDKDGNIVDRKVSPQFEKEHNLSWLMFFASMVSVRFPMSGFHKQLGGLKMTINVFQEKTVIVKMLETDHILAVIIPWKTNSVFNAMNILFDEKFH